jgi:extracellular factor (EF) 3-hydroxypalmitic acid methyl ester biosynthesis protein
MLRILGFALFLGVENVNTWQSVKQAVSQFQFSKLDTNVIQMGTEKNTRNGVMGDSLVMAQTNQGLDLQGTIVHLDRYTAVFELYNPALTLRVSEVLSAFKIHLRDHLAYSGRAVIRSLINTGLMIVCEVTLAESAWVDVSSYPTNGAGGNGLAINFNEFIRGWQRAYQVSSEYKVIIADIYTFLADLHLWANQIEVGIRSYPEIDRLSRELEVAQQLRDSLIPATNSLFDRFEAVADEIEEERLSAHYAFGRRQLHPLLLCSPFLYRSYMKPLGYAGDYEMINMIIRNQPEGSSLFAKLVNSYLLDQAPPHAVRNRVFFLLDKIIQESSRVSRSGKVARIYNLACGAAREVQIFLEENPLAERVEFDLLDFNEETLQHASQRISEARRKYNRNTPVKFIKKSVHHLLKEKDKQVQGGAVYDLIYCSGLYDYLSDRVCKSLNTYLYEQLLPGGLMVIGNFSPATPRQNLMEHFLEWFLIYRDNVQLMKIAPEQAAAEHCVIRAEPSGANIFLEVRKPK